MTTSQCRALMDGSVLPPQDASADDGMSADALTHALDVAASADAEADAGVLDVAAPADVGVPECASTDASSLEGAPDAAPDGAVYDYFNGFEGQDAYLWTAFGYVGVDRNAGLAHSGANDGWVAVQPGEKNWNAIQLSFPNVPAGAVCRAQIWTKTSVKLVIGELDVRDGMMNDLSHVGPIGYSLPSCNPADHGYNVVNMSFVAGTPPNSFIVGVWGDGTNDDQTLRVDDLSIHCEI